MHRRTRPFSGTSYSTGTVRYANAPRAARQTTAVAERRPATTPQTSANGAVAVLWPAV